LHSSELDEHLAAPKPLTILGNPHQPDGSGFYRFFLPYEYLAYNTDHRILLPEPGDHFFPDDDQIKEIDVIAGQRWMNPKGVELLSRWQGKTKIVYEVDDDILSPDTSSGLPHLHDPVTRDTIRKCLGLVDLITVSTWPLYDEFKPYNDNIQIIPNFIHADLLFMDRPRRDRLTVGWAGGMSHLIDWMDACDPIRDVLLDNPDVDMHFVGIDYSPVLKLDHPCRYTPWSNAVRNYFRSIDFDIGLAPLADTPFNRCKSHIKALEYMSLGIPVIAADRPAYHDMVIDGVTGYLVHNADEWRDRLTELINDEAMRDEMGKAGREHAAKWTIQKGWTLWRDAYEGVTGWRS
jgi:glycosyltransferase involved in cell wall biosynthesis